MSFIPRKFGNVGSSIGVAALGLAVIHFFLGLSERAARPDLWSTQIADARGAPGPTFPLTEPGWGPDEIALAATIGLGVLAIAFGIVGFLRREGRRSSTVAMALGTAAIAVQFAIAVTLAALTIILVVYIRERLGFA